MSTNGPTGFGTISVSLSNSDELQGANNTVATPPPEGYYVIVGRGVTAWYNHLTLLLSEWGQKRLSNAASAGPALPPVMHIGYEEPWSRRRKERMGQWPRMLDFFKDLAPRLGLRGIPPEDEQSDWLESAIFARSIREAQDHVCSRYRHVRSEGQLKRTNDDAEQARAIELRSGFVSIIESRAGWAIGRRKDTPDPGEYLPKLELDRWNEAEKLTGDGARWANPDCPYRLSVYHEGKHSYVYAYKIDICTGPGQPRLFAPKAKWKEKFATPELYEEHLPRLGVPPAEPTERIIDGNVYIGSKNDHKKTVIVFKGNPVGAQSVQSALDMPRCEDPVRRVWWVVNKGMIAGNDADVPGKRNLLEMIGNMPIKQTDEAMITAVSVNHGESWVPQYHRNELLRERLHRVGWHEIEKISEEPSRKIKCTFTLHPYGDLLKDVPLGTADKAAASLAEMLILAEPFDGDLLPGMTTATQAGKKILASITADLLVYSLGQERGATAEGTVLYMTQKLGALSPVFDPGTGFPMAVTNNFADPDADGIGRVRALGAAIMGASTREADTQHNNHGATLPQEMPAGGGGLNLAITNIRRANRFKQTPVRVNTASVAELVEAGLSAECARVIVAERSATDRGYSIDGLIGKLIVLAVDQSSTLTQQERTKITEDLGKLQYGKFAF
ncbi:hypothetical protein WMF28_43975 [Sorangium sp. So ce590]|uniref:hypothetical protein n=1 Tax=Sorangium sp. So ce590 TaxID=3133317 RepID=UPI003F616915